MKRKSLEILDTDRLASILETFSSLDDARWEFPGNYDSINFCSEDLSADEKLLTHWISYIMDRGTAFERVWDVGGYVISHLVRSYSREKDKHDALVWNYLKRAPEKKGLRLECAIDKPNARLVPYGFTGRNVHFSSRYMPGDILSICRTLYILDRVSNRSLARYVWMIVHDDQDMGSALYRLAVALHYLSYADVGLVSGNDMRKRIRRIPEALEQEMNALSNQPWSFMSSRVISFSSFDKKRLWCAIRDYMKSVEHNEYFVQALKQVNRKEAKRWLRDNRKLKSALPVIELPGDVWNNNDVFREGLFTPYINFIPRTWDMPRTVRAIYKALPPGKTRFYPEQMDVSFSFVPRMCKAKACSICMFGAGIREMCHKCHGLLCPVVLAACGYKYRCNPRTCSFQPNSVKGVCQNSVFLKA